MTKKDVGFALAVFIALALSLFLNLKTDRLELVPLVQPSNYAYHLAQETAEVGSSQTWASSEKDGSLRFEYVLSKTAPYPFAGMFIHKPMESNPYLDFSKFDEIRITLKSLKGEKIPIALMVDASHYFPKSDPFPDIPATKVIDYHGEREYRIRKQELEIPHWWLRYHGFRREQIGATDYSKVRSFFVINGQDVERGDKDEITVKRISFVHDNRAVYLTHAALLLLLCAAVLTRIILARRRKMPVALRDIPVASEVQEVKVPVPYKANDIEDKTADSKITRIVNYFAEHYANPELSVQDLEKALGISARSIGILIRSELNSSFKSYLNKIRLTEVKRLLQETDLSISEIAYRTGYNHISHFNRVFKSEFGVSPKEFRSSGS